jgi:tetratricopeptide (TPR) repeat protein
MHAMPKKSQLPPSANDSELDAFALQVEQTLNHFAAPDWVGRHSPLAAPYFLGRALTLPTPQDNIRQRGEALQSVLLQAAAQIDDELRELLQVVYFQRNPQLENVGLSMLLHMSERTFYRTRLRAIQALAQALNQLVLPSLRPEMPNERALIGREQTLSVALAALHEGSSLYLSGPSGVGKTTLGTTLVHHWLVGRDPSRPAQDYQTAQPKMERRAFWYTLRAGLNDQAASLLFALGFFLRSLGAGYTWRQLVADRGVANPERILGLLRYDLNSLQPRLPLLCLDELDVLQAEISDHAQILHLLEELRAHCSILFMGQQVVLDAAVQLRLAGLDAYELDHLLEQVHAPPLSEALRQRLLTYTRGNPALLLLFTALVRDGDDPEAALQTMAKAPSLEALFHRIWRRLNQEERHLLMQLALFRSPAPLDAWQEQAIPLAGLRQRDLVQVDEAGGVRCDPHLQRLACERIPAELKPWLHSVAVDVREARAEYLSAMYHAIEARQPARAVWLWFIHRDDEIDRGGAAVALGLLKRISPTDLGDERDRTTLRVARAELYHLTGKPEEAEQELQATNTAAHTVLRAYVRRYEGFVLDVQGRVEQALEKYRESLDTLAGLPQFNEVIVHSRLSFLHLYRLHNVEQARKEALLARAKADGVLGDIEIMAGRYTVALEHLLSAKAHAEQSGSDLRALSRIYSFLGHLYLRLREFDSAIFYIDRAIDCDRKRGDEVGPLYDLLNRANVHMLAGHFEQSYDDAQNGLEVAERLKNSYLIAGLAAGVAEACYGLQQWQQAEEYAAYSLNQEEEFFRAPALVILGMVRQKQGRYSEGVTLLTAALENAKQIEDRYTEAYVWRSTGLVHRDEGRLEPARVALENACRIYQDLNLPKDAGEVQELFRELL